MSIFACSRPRVQNLSGSHAACTFKSGLDAGLHRFYMADITNLDTRDVLSRWTKSTFKTSTSAHTGQSSKLDQNKETANGVAGVRSTKDPDQCMGFNLGRMDKSRGVFHIGKRSKTQQVPLWRCFPSLKGVVWVHWCTTVLTH